MMTPRVDQLRSVLFAAAAALLVASTGLLPGGSAHATLIGEITLEASSSEGSATARFSGAYDENGVWSVPDAVALRSNEGVLIGTLEGLDFVWQSDPVVSLSFTATAGPSDTTFILSTATLSFPTIPNPTASASASMTLTDTRSNGAQLDPVAPNSGLFLALYDGGTLFAELIGPMSVSGGTLTASSGAGPQTILGSVSSIQAQFAFRLSAQDSAAGQGQFTVVPEPSTALLLLVGVLPLLASRARLRTRT
jgi:hypothetical protein